MATSERATGGPAGPIGPRRSYSTPRLVGLGDISRLVEGAGSLGGDGVSEMGMGEGFAPAQG
jgi:hypothetical protein